MTVTGSSNSRLQELRKYVVGGSITTHYKLSYNSNADGVNPSLSQYSTFPYTIVYYLGGIIFTDIVESDLTSSSTIFSYSAEGTGETNNFVSNPYYKHPDKSKIISQPKINDDVFIIRDEQSALDKNYKLEYITNLVELTTYAGGRFFNIVNNT